MSLYDKGAAEGGFEAGIRMALEGILASPRFVFRFEERPAAARAGEVYALSDLDLASRLSFFLWATGPDEELLRAGGGGPVGDAAALERQTRRMLADRRSDVLASRFAAQWLRLQDLDKINPDVRVYPDFDEQLKIVDASRDRAVLPPHRPRGPAGAGAVLRGLHVCRRAAGEALRNPERDRRVSSAKRRIRMAGGKGCWDTAAS